jgi:hypothetical protein
VRYELEAVSEEMAQHQLQLGFRDVPAGGGRDVEARRVEPRRATDHLKVLKPIGALRLVCG